MPYAVSECVSEFDHFTIVHVCSCVFLCVCACVCLRVCGLFMTDGVGGIEIRTGDENTAARVCVREHTAKGEGRDLQSKKPGQALHVIGCQRVYISAFS